MTQHFAGSERYAVELANAQSRRHEVCMLMPASEASSGTSAWAFRLDPAVKQVPIGGWKLSWPGRIRRELDRWGPEVAHAHLSVACKALGAWRSAALRVATLHIAYKPQQHQQLDALIAIAPWQLQTLPAAMVSTSAAIANWSAPPPSQAGARQRLRSSLGLQDSDWLVGTLGRAERSKGWDVLIDAFAQAAVPNSRLVLVGGGKDWSRLRKKAPPTVVMPGFTDEPQNWLAAFDLFVSAARSEPFGLVFLEAMHEQLPILATATEGAKFLGESFGLPLVTIDSVASLSESLRHAGSLRPPRRQHPLDRFNAQQQTARIEAFYKEQLAVKGRSIK